MRLYPQKLNSVEELQQERKRLLQERDALEQDELFSIEGLVGSFAAGSANTGFSILDILPVSNPWVKAGLKLAGNWFSRRKEKKQEANDTGETPKKHSKSRHILGSLAREVIGGYLKWKGLELSAKGVNHIIKKKREAHRKES